MFLFRLLPDIAHLLYDPLNQRKYINNLLDPPFSSVQTEIASYCTLPKMNEGKAEGNLSLSSDANKTFLRYNNLMASI